MKRVMIVGQPGSGKSTLARHLGELTGLPVVHVDRIHYRSGWQERPPQEKIELALASHAEPDWIFEGGLSATYDERLRRADTLIVLDLPFWRRFWRVVRRTLRYYGRSRPDMAEGCKERFAWDFLKWIWDTRNTGRDKLHELTGKARPEMTVVLLQSPADVDMFLNDLSSGTVPA